MPLFWKRSRSSPTRTAAENAAAIAHHVAEQIQQDGPGLALAIVKSATVVHAAGYGLADLRRGLPIAPDTIFHLASCGKQFTGCGIAMLAEARKLELDDPIAKHLPELAGFGRSVTIRHLLHHTSGIRDLCDDDGVQEVLARCERPTNADVIRTYAELRCPMSEAGIQPGDRFAYSNSGYDLLGAAIERVSGQSYRDFFQSRVFDPLGMKDTFSIPDARVGSPRCATGYAIDDRNEWVEHGGNAYDGLVGSGSFYTTAPDLCLYDQALRTYRLVSEAGTQEGFTVGQTNDGNDTNYGFGWYLGYDEGTPLADHAGAWNGYHSYICCYLDQPLSVFVLSNNPEVDLVEVANLATDIYR